MTNHPGSETWRIEALVAIGALAFGIYRSIQWIKEGKTTPEPWNADIEASIHQPEAVPVCHRCFDPQLHDKWFCPNCGTAVGPYNNYLPYVYIFSQGEVLRAGVMDRVRPGFLTSFGYLIYSACSYSFFAPIYWFFFTRNFCKHRNAETGNDIDSNTI